MADRPQLSKNLDPTTFRSFYYLKEELVAFAKQGGFRRRRQAGADRAHRILSLHRRGAARSRPGSPPGQPRQGHHPRNAHRAGLCMFERHRAFFVGSSVPASRSTSPFKKMAQGKRRQDLPAGRRGLPLASGRKKRPASPHRQTVRIQYLYPGLFAANPGKTLPQAILCWKRKRRLPATTATKPPTWRP